MKICRFKDPETQRPSYGMVVGEEVFTLRGDLNAGELGNPMPTEPLLFLKAPSAIIADGDAVELPEASERVEHEGELGLVIGRRCSRLDVDEDPLAYGLGF